MPSEIAALSAVERIRTVALMGPSGGGKTTLFDRLMAAAETPVHRPGMPLGHCRFDGKPWLIVDCQEFLPLPSIDLVIVVCEPSQAGVRAVAPLLASLQARGVAHLLFTNKVDAIFGRLRETVATLQAQSTRPLVLRQVPVQEKGAVLGHIDLVSARAYGFRPEEPPALFAVPSRPRGPQALVPTTEPVADRDAGLYARLLNDVRVSPDEIHRQLRRKRRSGDFVEVILGCALHGNGIARLWRSMQEAAIPTDRRCQPRPDGVPRRMSA
jgi:elongation factor G